MAFKPSEPPLLIVINLHQIEVEPPSSWSPRSTLSSFTPNVPILLNTFRKQSFEICHVQHSSRDPKDGLYPSEANAAFIAPHSCATPLLNEPVFTKDTGSVFMSSMLKDKIWEMGCNNREMVVTGMESAKCINSTVRTGSDMGLNMVVVVDACASFGIDYLGKEEIGAEEVDKVAMGVLDGYARLVETKDMVKRLQNWNAKGGPGGFVSPHEDPLQV